MLKHPQRVRLLKTRRPPLGTATSSGSHLQRRFLPCHIGQLHAPTKRSVQAPITSHLHCLIPAMICYCVWLVSDAHLDVHTTHTPLHGCFSSSMMPCAGTATPELSAAATGSWPLAAREAAKHAQDPAAQEAGSQRRGHPSMGGCQEEAAPPQGAPGARCSASAAQQPER